MSSSIGNDKCRRSVSSIFRSIGDIQSSNCLVEVPLSSSKSVGCILVCRSSILEKLQSSLSRCLRTCQLDSCLFKLMVCLIIRLLSKAKIVLGLGQIVLSCLLSLLGRIQLFLCVIHVFISSVVILLSILKVGVGLSLSKLLSIKNSLGILKRFFSSS